MIGFMGRGLRCRGAINYFSSVIGREFRCHSLVSLRCICTTLLWHRCFSESQHKYSFFFILCFYFLLHNILVKIAKKRRWGLQKE